MGTVVVHMVKMSFRRLELGGGQVDGDGPWTLRLPPLSGVYGDAQLDDYGLRNGRSQYPWRAPVTLRLRARFSHAADALVGTAGFGFWNAPFGDPTVRTPSLPRAAWFFYGDGRNHLPFAPAPGYGWMAATLDATTPQALALAPFAPLVMGVCQVTAVRRRLWPWVQAKLGIATTLLPMAMTDWHSYELQWRRNGCLFLVDGVPQLATPFSPGGPLGFVCWLDNQYLVATVTGRFRWGVTAVAKSQTMQIADLEIVAQDA